MVTPALSPARVGLSRRMAEILVTAAASVLVAGVLLGTGFAQTVLTATDGLTWLGDDTRGEVIQINSTTGRPETRLTVAPPGNPLLIAQTDTLLVITDTATGLVTVIDIATLTSTDPYRSTPDNTKVLLTTTDLYVADRATGTITRLDPATARPVGPTWVAGQPLADAAIDTTGTLWVLTARGTLHQLRWSTGNHDGLLVDLAPPRRVAGAGPESALVSHEVGVTIFAAESGQITQLGTGEPDVTIAAPALTLPAVDRGLDRDRFLAPAEHAPADLVPVAIPSANTVILFAGQATSFAIDTGRHECPRPTHPAVFQGEVYVPCGNGTVLVLRGESVRSIATGSDRSPSLVLDEGLLFINTRGGPTTGWIIDADGNATQLGAITEDVPPQDPSDRPPSVLDPPLDRGGGRSDQPGDPNGPNGPAGPDDPTDPDGPSGPGSGSGAPAEPTGVTARVTNGQVTVSWQHAGGVDGFTVLTGGSPMVDVSGPLPATQRSFILGSPPLGTPLSYVVRVVSAGLTADSSPSLPVTVTLAPDPPTVAISSVDVDLDNGDLTLAIAVGAANPRGTPVTGYTITAAIAVDSRTATLADPGSTSLTLNCAGNCLGETVTVTAVANSAAGSSVAAATSHTPDLVLPNRPFPDGPFDGDAVLGSVMEQYIPPDCGPLPPQPPPLPCMNSYWQYSVQFSPPTNWRTFGGTCTETFTGVSFDCASTTELYLGLGDGSSWTVAVQACGPPGCVTSDPLIIATQPPQGPTW